MRPSSLLNLADPNISFANKAIWSRAASRGTKARIADHKLKKAARHGDLPLSFSVVDAEASGRRVQPPPTLRLGPAVPDLPSFVNQRQLDAAPRASAMGLLQAAEAIRRVQHRLCAVQLRRPPGDASMSNTLARVARCVAGPHAPPE